MDSFKIYKSLSKNLLFFIITILFSTLIVGCQENKEINKSELNGTQNEEKAKEIDKKVKDLSNETMEVELDTNLRMGVSIAESIIDEYSADDTGAKNLETALAEKLKNVGLKNPFTKSQNIMSTPLKNDDTAVFWYMLDANEISDAGYDVDTKPSINYVGAIKFDAYLDGKALRIKFTPIGSNGLPIHGKSKSTN